MVPLISEKDVRIPMRVLIIGNGAREHAIAKKLAKEEVELVAAMAKLNPGIATLCSNVDLFDLNKPENYAKYKDVDIAFIGPEAPLAVGVADYLEGIDVPTVGPLKDSAKLEWSKAYARTVLAENGIVGNPKYRICKTQADVKEFLDKQHRPQVPLLKP